MININLNIIQELKTLAVMDREPDTPQKLLDKALAAKIIMLTEDGRTMANNWGFYLFSKELDSEPQLRNNITVIMVSGLLDTVEAEKRVIDKYKLEAEEKGYSNMAIWCDRAKEWCIAAQDILSLFSKEEQLFIQDRRNKLVHGWLNKTHQERFNIQYFNGEKIVQEQVSKEEYNDIIKIPML